MLPGHFWGHQRFHVKNVLALGLGKFSNPEKETCSLSKTYFLQFLFHKLRAYSLSNIFFLFYFSLNFSSLSYFVRSKIIYDKHGQISNKVWIFGYFLFPLILVFLVQYYNCIVIIFWAEAVSEGCSAEIDV